MDNPALLIMIAAAVLTAAMAAYGASGVDPRDALAGDVAATALAVLALPPPGEPARPDTTPDAPSDTPPAAPTMPTDSAQPPRPSDLPLDAMLSIDEHARLLLAWCQSDRAADGTVTPRPASVITDADLIYVEMCAEMLLAPHRWNRVGGKFNLLTVSASGNAKAYATDKTSKDRYRIYTIPAHPALATDSATDAAPSAPMQRAA